MCTHKKKQVNQLEPSKKSLFVVVEVVNNLDGQIKYLEYKSFQQSL
jgi:hypothetical protein